MRDILYNPHSFPDGGRCVAFNPKGKFSHNHILYAIAFYIYKTYLTLLINYLTFDFSFSDETMFLVGTDEGLVYKCTTEYSSRFLQTYHAHNSPVYNICWNTYVTSVFLTCAAEWMIKIWDHKCP